MKQEHSAFLYLPRMHREFLPAALSALPPEALLTLWPGLPRAAEGTYVPTYPWSEAQAAAALADFERASQWGSVGSPIQSQTVRALNTGMKSPAEKENTPKPGENVGSLVAALRQPAQPSAPQPIKQSPAQAQKPEIDLALRAAAQSNLVLAWSQERRLLEMLALRRKVEKSQESLQELFSPDQEGAEGLAIPNTPDIPVLSFITPDELALLPPWPLVLSAAAHFVQPDQALLTAEPALVALLHTLPRCEQTSCPRRHPAFACTQAGLGTVLGQAAGTVEAGFRQKAQLELGNAGQHSLEQPHCWYYPDPA